MLGDGKRVFGKGTMPAGSMLVSTRASRTGVIMSVYKRSGELKPGSFVLETPTESEIDRRKTMADGKR